MIISHQYRFIFIKTRKTAGTSIEVYLSGVCGEKDTVTEVYPPEAGHQPRNFRGLNNPFESSALQEPLSRRLRHAAGLRRFYNHMPATLVRSRVSESIWQSYFKFCVERNPWDKTVSMYHMYLKRGGRKISFDEFIAEYPRLPINYPLYCDGQGELLVDRILRYESLDDELATVFKSLGVPFDGTLRERAKSNYRADDNGYQAMYSEAGRVKVAETYRQEIELLGYEFD